jgi:hypothetical protein
LPVLLSSMSPSSTQLTIGLLHSMIQSCSTILKDVVGEVICVESVNNADFRFTTFSEWRFCFGVAFYHWHRFTRFPHVEFVKVRIFEPQLSYWGSSTGDKSQPREKKRTQKKYSWIAYWNMLQRAEFDSFFFLSLQTRNQLTCSAKIKTNILQNSTTAIIKATYI